MPIFVYRCDCGRRFERLMSRDAAPPDCPECGASTRKIPAGPSLGRGAGASSASQAVPMPWRGTVDGGPEKVQREVKLRENILAKGAGHAGNPGSAKPAGE
jgi:putative FmdB family regulatory protein